MGIFKNYIKPFIVDVLDILADKAENFVYKGFESRGISLSHRTNKEKPYKDNVSNF